MLLTSLEFHRTVGLLSWGRHLSCPQGACGPEAEKKATGTKNSDVQQNKDMPKKEEEKETIRF